MASQFDPNDFLSEDDDSGSGFSTEPSLIPVADYGNCILRETELTGGIISKGKREGEPWMQYVNTFEIDDPALRDSMEREEVLIKSRVMLDLKPDPSRPGRYVLDRSKGRNVELGRLMTALGINEPGKKLELDGVGHRLTLRIGHGTYEGKPFSEVKGYAQAR